MIKKPNAIKPIKPCGVFRRCDFSDGSQWIVVTNHDHQPGDDVLIYRVRGNTRVTLGPRLTVMEGNKPLLNCFRVASQKLRAVEPKVAAEIAELDRMYRQL